MSWLVAVTFLAATVAFSPVTHARAEVAPSQQTQMTLGIIGEPDSLNPFIGVLVASYWVYDIVYDLLVGIGPSYEPVPQVAESWSVSSDNLTWTFNLFDNITFHDGTPLTAHDVEWTFEFVINNSAGASASYLTNIYPETGYTDAYADAIKAVDDYTLRITTIVPKANMLSIWVPILEEAEWSALPPHYAINSYRNEPPTGTGPFVFDSWVPTQYIQFHANPAYHLGAPKFDLLIWKFYQNSFSLVEDLKAGLIDASGGAAEASMIEANQWASLQGVPNLRTYMVEEIGVNELGLNSAPEWTLTGGTGRGYNRELRNMSVHKALAQVIDKQFLVDTVRLGLATPGSSLIPPATPFWHYEVPDNELYKFNLAAANATLDPWYQDTDGDGVRNNLSNPSEELDFTLHMIDYDLEGQDAMTFYMDWASQVGIRITPVIVSEGQILMISYKADYDLYVWSWGGDADPDFLLMVMTTDQIPTQGGIWQDAWYSNPEYDDLYRLQSTQVNLSERQATVHRMQQILYRDTPYIILWYSTGLYGVRTDTFSNWPDFTQYPGLALFGMGNGFMFLQVTPGPSVPNTAPYNVEAGGPYVVPSNISRTYTATAQDAEQTNLSFVWNFGDGTPAQTVRAESTTGSFAAQTSHTYTMPGTYTLNLTVSDGRISAYDEATVTVFEPTGTEGTVAGFVKDGAGAPISGATVALSGGVGSTSSGVDGSYNIFAPAGAYTIWANRSGYAGDVDTVTITTGQTSWVNFTLVSQLGSVSGTVTDAKGNPIAGATVVVSQGGVTKGQDTTDAQGNYSIGNLAPGTYNLTVSAEGYRTTTESFVLAANQQADHDVTLTKEAAGLSALAWAGIAAVIIVAVAAAAVLLLRRRKAAGGAGGAGPPEAPPSA